MGKIDMTSVSVRRRGGPLRLLPGDAVALFISALVALSGCAKVAMHTANEDEAPLVHGPAVHSDRTPYEPVLACLADELSNKNAKSGAAPTVFTVGDVKDYTGKYNINEGNAITQGGALMVSSALGKLGATIRMAERFDSHITDMELGYIDRRQLGDGNIHPLDPTGQKVVPWLPYFGGTILRSDYYIVGGITELNYNIQSGGVQVSANLAGPSARTFTESVAIDLRLVDTKTAQVVKTVSLEKQIVGYEVDAGIFQFFGSNLWDVSVGAKNQEPLQLGVRAALEEATFRLVSYVAQLPAQPCLGLAADRVPNRTADEYRATKDVHWQAVDPPVGTNGAVSTEQLGGANAGAMYKISFDFGSATISAGNDSVFGQIAQAVQNGAVSVELLALDNENWDPLKRAALVQQRIQAFRDGLTAHGASKTSVVTKWAPPESDSSIYHDGPGFQKVAIVAVQQ